jgi:hypothetical protein
MKTVEKTTLLLFLLVFNISLGYAQEMEKMKPQDILYTTPTINDALPKLSQNETGNELTVRIHEDDWRQFEFVSLNHKEQINYELNSIDAIWKKHSVPIGEYTGFNSIHVRKKITKPLSIKFSKSEFEKLIGGTSVGITFLDNSREIEDVYAIRKAGYIFYAHITANKLVTLGVERNTDEFLPEEVAKNIKNFVDENDLALIHWRSRTAVHPPEHVYNYFTGINAKN